MKLVIDVYTVSGMISIKIITYV